jgi:hypothetical protein
MLRRHFISVVAVVICSGASLVAQQVPDRTFKPSIGSPAHTHGKGPMVCLDEAHANFHTLDDRFWAFGELLRGDGYVVRATTATFDRRSLGQCSVLVISNAQPSRGSWTDYPYPTPSAFTAEEVDATRQWVHGGGQLLVVPSTFIALMPRVAWQFGPDTKRIPVGGWLQGAVMRVESGRAAFFGEAAMFSAQVTGPERRPMGMNAPGAEQNAQFVLNVMHWLSGLM